jgi:diacylglycerol kinase family enzyme
MRSPSAPPLGALAHQPRLAKLLRLVSPEGLAAAACLAAASARLLSRGRPRPVLVLLVAWAGAHGAALPRCRRGSGWAGLAYALGHIAPVWQKPLLMASGGLMLRRSTNVAQALTSLARCILGASSAVAALEVAAARLAPKGPKHPRVAVVVNADSGSARASRRALRALTREAVEIASLERVPAPEVSASLKRSAQLVGPGGRLIVAGGDGTVGRAALVASEHGVELAVLPTGTGNDIARSLGIPLYPEEAAALALRGATAQMDLVNTNLGCFAHAAGVGMVATFAELTRDAKGWRRPVAYPLCAFRAWWRRDRFRVRVKVDSEEVLYPELPFELALVNAPRVGGRVGLSLPGARPDDGRVDLIGVYRGALRRALSELVHYLRSGVAGYPPRSMVRSGRSIEVELDEPKLVSLDGEPAGTTSLLRATSLPGACRVVVPKRQQRRGPNGPARPATLPTGQ